MDSYRAPRAWPTIVGVVLAVAVTGYVAAAAWRPAVTQNRDEVLATPSLPGLATRTDVAVARRHRLCVRSVVLPAATTRVVAQVAGVVDPRRLRVSAEWPARRQVARKVTVTDTSVVAYLERRRTTVNG